MDSQDLELLYASGRERLCKLCGTFGTVAGGGILCAGCETVFIHALCFDPLRSTPIPADQVYLCEECGDQYGLAAADDSSESEDEGLCDVCGDADADFACPECERLYVHGECKTPSHAMCHECEGFIVPNDQVEPFTESKCECEVCRETNAAVLEWPLQRGVNPLFDYIEELHAKAADEFT